jgi:hypothetical protein
MRTAIAVVALAGAAFFSGSAHAGGWASTVQATNQVASTPTPGFGYPDPSGAPTPGTCSSGSMNSNRSESWLAVQPGTENAVGTSKFFFDRYSTFYNFYLGAYTIKSGRPAGNVMTPGYDCGSTHTQAMPPTWTNVTDPNVDFDSQGRAYEVTLPFNAYWTNLHPNGAIGAIYSDDLGRNWTVANGGKYIEFSNNQSSYAYGAFQDKQWIAVNHVTMSKYRDHVYAAWAVFNGDAVKIRLSVSRDRGATFSAPVTITDPSQTGPSTTYVYPHVGADGTLWIALAAFDQASGSVDADIYVTRSTDDAQTFMPWVKVARAHGNPGDFAAGDEQFRDGILQAFAASQTYPGQAYVAYEDWNSATGQMDVRLAESHDWGIAWSTVALEDTSAASDTASTDQFQPQVAAGPGGALAVAFYDRRAACPAGDPSISLPAATHTCIVTSLQPYRESNGGAPTKLGSNVAITPAFDPSQPNQTVGGIGQDACATHDDPCSGGFLGDYFGLAISGKNIYALNVSTHYPSSVSGDGEQGPVYSQQHLLTSVSRSQFGL